MQQKTLTSTGQAVYVLNTYEYLQVRYCHVLIPCRKPDRILSGKGARARLQVVREGRLTASQGL